MNNREILIKILLFLRSNGINNDKILFALEKLPPHYFENLLGTYGNYRQSYFDEIVRLLKILQDAVSNKKKINNVLISNFKLGWFLGISALLGKRIYSISDNKEKINNLDKVFNHLKLTNIYIKKSTNFLDWKNVAPFDIIILFKNYKVLPTECTKLLDRNGILFFAKENINKVSIIKYNKKNNLEKLKINDFFLKDTKIL